MKGFASCIAVVLIVAARSAFAATTLANVSPVSADFGAVKVGATVSVPITFQNISTITVGIAGNGITTPGFALDAATCGQAGYQLAPGASCYFVASFTPSDNTGTPATAGTAFLVNAGNASQTAFISVSGSGTDNLVQVSPVGIDFGTTFIGQRVTVPVTFKNTHSAPISFAGGAPPFNTPFTADSGTCGISLAAGASCSYNYAFTPSAAGPVQTTTSVDTQATQPISITESFAISLQGTGASTLPSPNIAMWPLGFDFGSITLGHRATVLVNYKNNGASDATLSGGGINDSQGGTFAGFSTTIGGCTTDVVPSGAQCALQYVFLPHEAKAYTSSTSVIFNGGGNQLYLPIALAGTGVGALARVTPQTIDLGTVAFGTTASVPVTVTNTSEDALTNFTGGTASAPFATSTTCGASLPVGASCTYTYTFYAPAAKYSLKAVYTANTLLSFTNATGIQPIVPISITARLGDRIFGDGFGG